MRSVLFFIFLFLVFLVTSAPQDSFATYVKPLLDASPNTYVLSGEKDFSPNVLSSSFNKRAKSYIAVDYDRGRIIFEKDASQKMPIASLTKIMTAAVSLDLAREDEIFTVTRKSAKQIPTKIGLIPGEKLTLNELLHAVLLTSANDAAELIKEGIDAKYGGSVFIKAMNEKAWVLGLKNTKFDNPSGFDSEENFSTAEDLSILTHYALSSYSLISEIVKKESAVLKANVNHRKYDLYNRNALVGVYPGVLGVKIGNTQKASKTTVVLSEREGKRILVVLLGMPSDLERDFWASRLLDEAYNADSGLKMVNVNTRELQEKYNTWKSSLGLL